MTRGRKVENKRLKIDKVRGELLVPVDKSPALILSPGRVPQERSDRTLSFRSIRRASERPGGEVEFPVLANGLVANPGGGQRVPRPGSRVSPNNLSSGSAHRVYAADLWPCLSLSRSRNHRVPSLISLTRPSFLSLFFTNCTNYNLLLEF